MEMVIWAAAAGGWEAGHVGDWAASDIPHVS